MNIKIQTTRVSFLRSSDSFLRLEEWLSDVGPQLTPHKISLVVLVFMTCVYLHRFPALKEMLASKTPFATRRYRAAQVCAGFVHGHPGVQQPFAILDRGKDPTFKRGKEKTTCTCMPVYVNGIDLDLCYLTTYGSLIRRTMTSTVIRHPRLMLRKTRVTMSSLG